MVLTPIILPCDFRKFISALKRKYPRGSPNYAMWCDASPRHQRALQDRGTPGSPEKPISVADVFFHFRLFCFFSTEAATTSNATETHSPVLAVFHRTCSGRGSRPSGLVGFGEFPPPPHLRLLAREGVNSAGRKPSRVRVSPCYCGAAACPARERRCLVRGIVIRVRDRHLPQGLRYGLCTMGDLAHSSIACENEFVTTINHF